jgi:HEAT repeat protein
MRYLLLLVGIGLLALSGSNAAAQGGSSGSKGTDTSSKETWPTEVGGRPLSEWIKDIEKGRDSSIRETALLGVLNFGRPCREAAPAIIAVVRKDPDVSLRVTAINSLVLMSGWMKPDDRVDCVRAFNEQLTNNKQAVIRHQAALALSQFPAEARENSIPALVLNIHDQGSYQVRRTIVATLSVVGIDRSIKMGPGPDPRVIRAVSDVLLGQPFHEDCSHVRLEAVLCLGSLGKPAALADLQRAQQALLTATKDPDVSVQIWAHVAYMELDRVSEDGLNAVAKHLKDKDSNAKIHAAKALAAMGKDAKSKVSDVAELIRDRDLDVAVAGLGALADYGIYAHGALKAVQTLSAEKEAIPEKERKGSDTMILEMCKAVSKRLDGQEKAPAP